MKNLIIGPAFPLRGGIANFNEALCKAFLKAGTHSRIISFTLQYPSFLFPGKTQFDTSGKAPDGIGIIPMINSVNPLSWFKTAAFIRKQNPDYVIFRFWLPFMGPALGTIAKLVKRNKKIKVIAICDNIIPHEKRIGDKWFTKYFVNQCDGFVAMSKSVLNDIKKFTSNPNQVFIPHPIYDIFGEKVDQSLAKEHLGLKKGERHILFFGFIRKYKGLDLLLEAMADEKVKKLNVKLIIAGEFYEDKSYYDEIIERNNLSNQISGLKSDFIPSDEVKYYFCASDLVAQPYRTATQSGVTQIAYHFERPMLVTDVGGLSEIVPHNRVGYVCDVDPKSIASSIVDFFEKNRDEEFAINIKKEKLRFTWENMVKGIEGMVS